MKTQIGRYKQANRKVIGMLKSIGTNVKWPIFSGLLLSASNLLCVDNIDRMIDRIMLIGITLGTYLLTLVIIYGIKLGFWNDYLSKIRWPKRLLDCEHNDEEFTLLILVVTAVLILAELISPIFQIGPNLAFVTLLVGYMIYRMKYSSWLCAFSIVIHISLILGLLYHVYKLFMQL